MSVWPLTTVTHCTGTALRRGGGEKIPIFANLTTDSVVDDVLYSFFQGKQRAITDDV